MDMHPIQDLTGMIKSVLILIRIKALSRSSGKESENSISL